MDDQRRKPKRTPLAERFMAKVEKRGGDGCWEWTGHVMENGYGQAAVESGIHRLAHRVSYELHVGPIPEGLVIDHRCHSDDKSCSGGDACRHRRCVNPDHLEPVTQTENMIRGRIGEANRARAAEQTQCKHGHPFSGENLFYREARGKKQRACRACSRKAGMLSERRRRAKKKLLEVCGPHD